ncbi:hypothetical protein DFH11DRAFT_911203 [Phellopilus nigrolimitatus]|nr:hypothetical protein DFH11DRAFT_911203 [Phellopilus nigrolimitatus]
MIVLFEARFEEIGSKFCGINIPEELQDQAIGAIQEARNDFFARDTLEKYVQDRIRTQRHEAAAVPIRISEEDTLFPKMSADNLSGIRMLYSKIALPDTAFPSLANSFNINIEDLKDYISYLKATTHSLSSFNPQVEIPLKQSPPSFAIEKKVQLQLLYGLRPDISSEALINVWTVRLGIRQNEAVSYIGYLRSKIRPWEGAYIRQGQASCYPQVKNPCKKRKHFDPDANERKKKKKKNRKAKSSETTCQSTDESLPSLSTLSVKSDCSPEPPHDYESDHVAIVSTRDQTQGSRIQVTSKSEYLAHLGPGSLLETSVDGLDKFDFAPRKTREGPSFGSGENENAITQENAYETDEVLGLENNADISDFSSEHTWDGLKKAENMLIGLDDKKYVSHL